MPSPPLPSLPKQWFLLLCNSHTFLTSYYNLSFNEVSIHKKNTYKSHLVCFLKFTKPFTICFFLLNMMPGDLLRPSKSN